MKAVVCEHGDLEVADMPEPRPDKRQLIVAVTGCGICGSDLHARHHADAQADVLAEVGYDGFMRSSQRVVMGHEFCGEIVERGPECETALSIGTPVVALPLIRKGPDMHAIGLSVSAPGAYAEQVVVEESLTFGLPNGLTPAVGVLTEPMAIGHHAVRRSEIDKKDVAIVIGCGPVGLTVIAMLHARGVRTIVASDFSPGRRALATACGAHVVVDPREGSPYRAAGDHRWVRTVPDAARGALDTIEKLEHSRVPVPWHMIWRTAQKLGVGPKRPVIFECVGLPGIIDDIITSAPLFSRVVVVGVCSEPDQFRPVMAINKEIDLRFVVGYTPLEFRDTLHLLAEGKVNAAPIVTGTVGLPGVDAAFTALADPEHHAKIIIDRAQPGSDPCVADLKPCLSNACDNRVKRPPRSGLAAAVALYARDHDGPKLCFQFLASPELDDRLETMSMRTFVDTPLWSRPAAKLSWEWYLVGQTDDIPAYAAPSRATDLSGLPPAYVSTMEFDPMRDEGVIYALRMLEAGVAVELHQYRGTFHGSAMVEGATVSKREADERIAVWRHALRLTRSSPEPS